MAVTSVLAILGLALMPQTGNETRDITLTFRPESPVAGVSVIGDFNHWDPNASPMSRSADGTWSAVVNLKVGSHLFKYRLKTGETIVAPGYATKTDLGGNTNSVLIVNPADFDAFPGVKGDGVITKSALRHRPDASDIGRVDAHHFWFRMRTRASDVEAVSLLLDGRREAMRVVETDGVYDTWQGAGAVKAGKTDYAFEITDGTSHVQVAPFVLDAAAWPVPDVPEWANGAVYYQIFPERFDNGDKSNDGEGVEPWGSKPTFRNRMGGDLRGIINHLDYLKDLGVQCIYLNPIFKSGSNHGYDTYDYMLVDPRFGTNDELKELVAKAHEHGIRVILDAVFNHSGTRFFAFENLRFHGQTSDYKDWYFVSKYPLEVQRGQKTYRTFSTSFNMPKLNTDNPATKRYLLNMVRYWMTFADLDGWRLDVADEVSQDFWRDFRKEVKSIKKDAVIIGEVWPDAHVWLQGDQHDSVMNYRWREATLYFFRDDSVTASAFEEKLQRVREDYPAETLNNLYLLLDSHDTMRVRNEMKGDRNREDLAIAFQFAYPGAPAIYYGDEVGMEGDRDPDCRRCMIWDEATWDKETLSLYRSLIDARKRNAALRTGTYEWISAGLPDSVFGFTRSAGHLKVQVYLNRSSKEAFVKADGKLLAGRGATLGQNELKLAPFGFAYLEK